jgi:hypothetical protein
VAQKSQNICKKVAKKSQNIYKKVAKKYQNICIKAELESLKQLLLLKP